nr:MAG TPA: hypothetical protein [Caudoviricetes sp.]
MIVSSFHVFISLFSFLSSRYLTCEFIIAHLY